MSWQVLAHRAVDVFNKYTKTSKPQKTHYCGSKQKQTEKGLLQAKDRKKTELKDFQLYTLLPGNVSLLPHVAGCWRLLHQLLGPRDHRGLESAVLRPGDHEPLARPLADTRCSHGDGRPSGVGFILQARFDLASVTSYNLPLLA